MIRKIKLYIALVAVLLSASSCLDKYPQDAIPQDDAIKTVSDVRQALIGIYAQFKNSSLYSGYLTLLPDIQTDQVYAVKGYTNVYGDVWLDSNVNVTKSFTCGNYDPATKTGSSATLKGIVNIASVIDG